MHATFGEIIRRVPATRNIVQFVQLMEGVLLGLVATVVILMPLYLTVCAHQPHLAHSDLLTLRLPPIVQIAQYKPRRMAYLAMRLCTLREHGRANGCVLPRLDRRCPETEYFEAVCWFGVLVLQGHINDVSKRMRQGQ